MAEYSQEEIEAGYTYDVEFVEGKAVYKKIPIPKADLPVPKVQYTTSGRAKYNKYAKKTAAKNRTVIPIEKWMPINFPKGIVK